MRYLHEVVLGDRITCGNLGDCRKPVFLERQVHQKAQRIISMNGEVQCGSSCDKKDVFYILLLSKAHEKMHN
jgi:hypothetical protein